ncbi:hypothetical protein Poly30_54500 [Planctomycetes bacterium Poly30]|uniref:Uncharacterized protein n=1 Tax=Saltatorellus ferox TaxID=2528018 RepID=A0A518F0Q5_9BACT|nr:hypothetical protein Poly30_54500 [Planctomycetes bacterium Poly30]
MTTTAILAAIAASFCPSQTQGVPAGPGLSQAVLPGALSPGDLAAAGGDLILDEPGDGRTWARGPRWKASFGAEGLTYIPFFGSDAPQNYPVVLNLSDVTIASEPLWLESRERSRLGESVTLDRGSMSEVYHVARDTVEQTFVFKELPVRGELVLEVDVQTELQMAAKDGGFTFSNALGEVRYGAATAIDAEGRSLTLLQESTASGFRIVVPADFVSQAKLPLVVDPILDTFSVTNDTRRQSDMDVAYDPANTKYQIVYSEFQSATDLDVIAISYSAILGSVLQVAAIDVSSSSWTMPRNASSYEEEQFLCVSLVGLGVGSRSVWGRTRDADTGNGSPQFQISGVGAEHVDVGGKGNEVATVYDYMVVWQETDGFNNDFDIVAQAVSGNASLTGGRRIIDGDVGDLDRFPSISKSSGQPGFAQELQEYMIVWEREVSPTNRNLRAQVIEYTGDMTGHSQFNAYTFSDSRRPDVSCWSRRNSFALERHWLVAFERQVGAAYKIFTVVAVDGSADNARSVQTMQNLDVDADHRDPHVAFNGQDFLLTYQTIESNGDYTAYLTALNVVHDDDELRTGLTLRREFLGTSEGAPGHVAIASHWDGGNSAASQEVGDAVALWLDFDSSTGDTEVGASLVEEVEISVLGAQFCEGALNSTGHAAWITARGFSWETDADIRLTCTEMPSNSFGHFLVSNVAGFVANPGGSQGNLCLQGAVGRFNRSGEIMNSGSVGSFTLFGVDPMALPSPTGPVSVQPGETWYFQCWFRDIGPSSNFSNAVEMTFD